MVFLQMKCLPTVDGYVVDVDESEPHIDNADCNVIISCGRNMVTSLFNGFSTNGQVRSFV